jgi:hypothetical protein
MLAGWRVMISTRSAFESASVPDSIPIPFTIPLPNMALRIRIARDFTTESQRHGGHRVIETSQTPRREDTKGSRSHRTERAQIPRMVQISSRGIHGCTDTVKALYSQRGVEGDHLVW